jgi:hypothetical protein
MGTGGRPGITFKPESIEVQEHHGALTVNLSADDVAAVTSYFKEYSDRKFVVNITIDPPSHDGDSGGDQNQNDAT